MEIGHAGKHRRTARSEAVGAERFMRGGDDLGMIGQAEVIVGTKINDRMGFPPVIQRRAGLGGTEQLRLVQFDGPLRGAMPFREDRRRLQRVFAVADEEIAQAKIAGIALERRRSLGLRRGWMWN